MADYLTRLASRTLGLTPVAEPIRAPLFAPERTAATTPVPEELLEAPNALSSLPRNPEQAQEPPAARREPPAQPGPRLISPGRQQDLAPRPLPGDEGNREARLSIADVSGNPPAAGKSRPPYRSEGVYEETLLPPSAAPSRPTSAQAGMSARAEVGRHTGRKPSPGLSEPAPPSGESSPTGRSRLIVHPTVSAVVHHQGPEPTRPSLESSPPLGGLPDLPDRPKEIPSRLTSSPPSEMTAAETLLAPLSAMEIPLPEQERPGPGRSPAESAPPRDQETPPVIEITIGRVEVKAVYPPVPPARPREAGPVAPRLSLEEYLRNQNGGRR